MPEHSGRSRLWRAFRTPNRSQLIVGVLLALVGFGAVTQVRTTDDDSTYAGYRQQDLIDVLNGLAGTSQRAQSELSRLEKSRDDLLNSTSKRKTALEAAQSEVDTMEILAGTVPVHGPGIRITVTETSAEVDVDTFIDLIQELRSAGAEAIQINRKVRLVAQSYFAEVAGGLEVDGTVLEPPYLIDAIGEPATLNGAVNFARGPADEFEANGAHVDTVQRNDLDITAVRAQ
jgi:uncharacterized protein YlxW (UPF0749 family)